MSISRPLRLLIAAALLPLLAACTSVGRDAQTGQIYIPADGANVRTPDMDVLNAVVVSGADGAGTVVATLVNNNHDTADALTGVSGTAFSTSGSAGAALTVTGSYPAVPADGHTNLADQTPIFVTGAPTDITAGGYVTLTFTFQNAAAITFDVPVVPATEQWASIALAPATS